MSHGCCSASSSPLGCAPCLFLQPGTVMSPGQSSSGGLIPQYPDQRGSSGCGQLGTGLPAWFWCAVPTGLRTCVSCPLLVPCSHRGFRVYAQLSGASEAPCPVGWRVSLIILPPGPHRTCPGAAPVCTEHSLGVGDRGAGWRLGPGNHTEGSAYTSSSGAQGRNRSLKSGK